MSAVINDAIYGGIIDYNPIERVFIGKSEKDARNKKMTNKQFHEWMDTAKRVLTPYHYSFTYAAVFGFRRAEIMGFHLKDLIVQANGTFMIHVWDSRTQGKPNGKGTTKTDKERYVALDVEGTRLLQSAIEETKRIKAEHGLVMHRDDFIFVDDKDGKPVYVTKLNECFQRVNKECAFQAYPNLLRHHFATEAVNSGAPIEHVANYLGNSPDVLRSNYLHIEDEVANNVVGMFEKQVKTGTGE
jgi:integrase